MDQVITVRQERVEETETLPKGWKRQGEEKRFPSCYCHLLFNYNHQ